MRIVVIGGGIAGLSAALRLHDELGSAARDHRRRRCAPARAASCAPARSTAGRSRPAPRRSWPGPPTIRPGRRAPRSGWPAGSASATRSISPATLSAGILWDGALRSMPAGTLMGVPADLARVDWAPTATADHDLGGPVLRRWRGCRGRGAGPRPDRRRGRGPAGRSAARRGLRGTGRRPVGGRHHARPGGGAARRAHPAGRGPRARCRSGCRPPARRSRPSTAACPGWSTRWSPRCRQSRSATGLPVRELARTGRGWRLTARDRPATPEPIDADAVVLAVPSHPAARLLGPGLAGGRRSGRSARLREHRPGDVRAAGRARWTAPRWPASPER